MKKQNVNVLKIIVAPDSFKGSLSAVSAAAAIESGIRTVFPDAQIMKVPIADGGEGTVDALITATGGRGLEQDVKGPLGDPVKARWGILGDGRTAVIEMAAASGLTLVPRGKLNPGLASTFGTGQLLRAALDAGMRRIIIGLGGSATNDGGAGMLRALGAKFLDANAEELIEGGLALAGLRTIDLSNLDHRVSDVEIIVASDVDNPLYGEQGASAVYGPQKGATAQMVEQLDRALQNYAEIAKTSTGRDIACSPGAGAAGGLGAGLMFFTNARIKPGVQIILEVCDFERLAKDADFIITGEGCIDSQTTRGKAPIGVASIARRYNVPTVGIGGSLGQGADEVLKCGIDGLMSAVPRPMSIEECLAGAHSLVSEAASRMCRLIRVGMKLSDSGATW